MKQLKPDAWLPTTKKEVEARGWDYIDVILFSGDAYVDHPSFGAAVIGRILEAEGLRVAIVPQPDWRGDFRDFKKLGVPRLFFGISAGAMDSMVNHYTANKRLRSDDAYTPDRRAGMRPDYPSIVYANILKELYPDVPVVLGGIEASLRRLTHYDYWQDKLKPGILVESRADLLIYGMGEQPIRELVRRLRKGETFRDIKDIKQTAYLTLQHSTPQPPEGGGITLFSHEECLKDKLKQAKNFRHIEEESNKYESARMIQRVGEQCIVVNPPYPPMSEKEIDQSFDLPYTRLPHPKYKGKVIPAYEMIKFSVNLHRGCFGGCAFCTISAHQGKFIASRSKESILKEVKEVAGLPDFKGYLTDLGGPSANMYRMKGKDESICRQCKKPSCIFPVVCKNLHADHDPMLEMYNAVDRLPEIKKSFIGSGIRYDLLLHKYPDDSLNQSARKYAEELIAKHVSGRLKVAPEHTQSDVLKIMRKPSFEQFGLFKKIFDRVNKQKGLNQQLIPYFISSHPGCTEIDMAELAVVTKGMNFHLEQVQDFTPTPMTLATEIYYTGYHPYTLEKVYTARSKEEKLAQRQYFFWYKPEFGRSIRQALGRLKRNDLINKLFGRSQ
ncbi:putative radical SAM protein YgiQ [Parabacteroides sp. PF5-5]|uniref:YgiQ family radical SAM protein n=1 Tax=unclassified Parabacteroides TaxID=2649774 RepID=UPI0024767AE4|nr:MULTISPECIES: YgiQ family radical SAM protein [unclassified Parabacteroides]MDH6306346.1 putative radical SAM protein YgiQ [Parabacteroides sp. PH5-39]MDH6314618.1 putative radical SAM protein YgiQ [Parabacteroides sp. PF5-13]MDH6321057.1 putative radical SAM protein YgiQ [Parabacteroides sp. PH5-13]MDH6324789.1 putative radical SAM protein YgiQ [Parabacteroides sp. PH5-8]MDH6325530.1 putative radical SAM protein YgiQ [Parabacteroides sp. PH5-41]